MSAASLPSAPRNPAVLFARVSRGADRAIVPVNECASKNDQTLPAFYCVHSASGVAGTDFLDLAELLEPAIRFYGIQAPPKLMADADFGKSIESIAALYADALVEFQPTGSFLLGGYCVGAVVALAIADNLRDRGREVGPLFAIDGVPENTKMEMPRWKPTYWRELFRNVYGWIKHADLMRSRTLHSLLWSISNNVSAIGNSVLGLNRAQKLDGVYAIEKIMDVSRFEPPHLLFINRLFAALFTYAPTKYSGEVVVYEAAVKPLLRLPQIGRIWTGLATGVEVVEIVGTHISMMHSPYVTSLGQDLKKRILQFSDSLHKTSPVSV